MSGSKIVFFSDKNFTGHVNVVGGYVDVLTRANAQVEHHSIDPVKDRAHIVKFVDEHSIVIQCFIPPLLEPITGMVNVALVFHEWSRMPEAWIKMLHRFDSVWISSRYNREVLANSGFAGHCDYIPAFIDPEKYSHKQEYSRSEPFCFISVGEWHFRKGFHLLAEAFKRAFPGDEKVELHIKTSKHAENTFSDSRIKLLTDRLNDREMAGLYAGYDAYLTTSLAEGLGLPVAEAMASGLPVAAVNWSGLTEFCDPEWSYDLPYQLSHQPYCSRPDYYATDQQCAVIDISRSAEVIESIYKASMEEKQSRAEKALEHLEEHNSETTVARVISGALEKLKRS